MNFINKGRTDISLFYNRTVPYIDTFFINSQSKINTDDISVCVARWVSCKK